MNKPYLSQQEAADYLSGRLPYPVSPQDVVAWHKDLCLRGERKPGGVRVYYTLKALDEFINEDERRRTQEHIQKKAAAEADRTRKIQNTAVRHKPGVTTDDFRKLAKDYSDAKARERDLQI